MHEKEHNIPLDVKVTKDDLKKDFKPLSTIECKCLCHDNPGVMHITPCCPEAYKQRIPNSTAN